MGSLSNLNDYSQGIVNFTDDREPGPRFNFDDPQDDLNQIATTSTIDIYRDQIEILEVVRPEVANLQFIVDVSGVPGTVVNFPIGYQDKVSNAGGIYTFNYIETVAEWEVLRDITITINPAFQGSFFYEVALNWYDGTNNQTLSWQVGEFVPVSGIIGVFGFDVDNDYIRTIEANLVVGSTLKQVDNFVQIVAVATLVCNAEEFDFASAGFTSQFTLNYPVYSYFDLEIIEYLANQPNDLGTQTIQDPFPGGLDEWNLEWSINGGILALSNGDAPNFSGRTLAQLNTELSNTKFYPDYSFTDNTSVKFTIYQKNIGGTFDLKEETRLLISNIGTGFISTRLFEEFDYNLLKVYPTFEEKKYGVIDAIVVGGGASGRSASASLSYDYASGGGGGGAVNLQSVEIDDEISYFDFRAGPKILTAGTGGFSSSLIARDSSNNILWRIFAQGGQYPSNASAVYGGGVDPRIDLNNNGLEEGGESGYPVALTDTSSQYELMSTDARAKIIGSGFPDWTDFEHYYGYDENNGSRGGGGAGAGGNLSFDELIADTIADSGAGGKSVYAPWYPNVYFGGGGGAGYDLNSVPLNERGFGGYQSGGDGAYAFQGSNIAPATDGVRGGGGGGGITYNGINVNPGLGSAGAIIMRIRAK